MAGHPRTDAPGARPLREGWRPGRRPWDTAGLPLAGCSQRPGGDLTLAVPGAAQRREQMENRPPAAHSAGLAVMAWGWVPMSCPGKDSARGRVHAGWARLSGARGSGRERWEEGKPGVAGARPVLCFPLGLVGVGVIFRTRRTRGERVLAAKQATLMSPPPTLL